MVNTYGNQSVIFRQVRSDTGSNPVLATSGFMFTLNTEK